MSKTDAGYVATLKATGSEAMIELLENNEVESMISMLAEATDKFYKEKQVRAEIVTECFSLYGDDAAIVLAEFEALWPEVWGNWRDNAPAKFQRKKPSKSSNEKSQDELIEAKWKQINKWLDDNGISMGDFLAHECND